MRFGRNVQERLARRRRRRAAEQVEALAVAQLRARLEVGREVGGEGSGHQGLDRLAELVVAGNLDPWSAADRLLAGEV